MFSTKVSLIWIFLVPCLSVLNGACGAKRVICYFPNWAGYRDGAAKFTPDQLDFTKCTNVLYAFAFLDPNTLTIKSSDPNADITLGYYQKISSGAKQAGGKASLSLGGWSDSGGSQYSKMLNSAQARSNFVTTTVQYLAKYGFEGLDIDIEYPACPQGNCDAGNPNDKQAFVALLKELKAAFQPRGWLLSAAVASYSGYIDKAYDVPGLNQYMDWIGVMTYDYHMPTESTTGPVSPLTTTSGDQTPALNTDSTIKYFMSKGASASKLIVGVPAYGYTFKLKSAGTNGYWAPSSGPGISGTYTKTTGTLAYYEICDKLKNGWTKVENNALGAYAYQNTDWVSFNSQADIMNKVNYVNQKGLGGMMVWDASMDDFSGSFCSQGKFPLISIMKNNLQ